MRYWEQFCLKNVGCLSRKYICQDLRKWVGRVGHLLTQIYNTKAYVCLSVCPRVGKTESLGLWSKVIVYCFKLSFCQNDRPMGQSFLQKESLLQYTMNLLKAGLAQMTKRSYLAHLSVHIFWKKILHILYLNHIEEIHARTDSCLWVSWEKRARILNY